MGEVIRFPLQRVKMPLAFRIGVQAYTQGIALIDNPYSLVNHTDAHHEWACGWLAAQLGERSHVPA